MDDSRTTKRCPPTSDGGRLQQPNVPADAGNGAHGANGHRLLRHGISAESAESVGSKWRILQQRAYGSLREALKTLDSCYKPQLRTSDCAEVPLALHAVRSDALSDGFRDQHKDDYRHCGSRSRGHADDSVDGNDAAGLPSSSARASEGHNQEHQPV